MLKLFNTLTRQKEEFKPIKDNVVSMYSCGPTVYGYAHIGNLRTYIFMDLVRRTLKLNGYKLKGVLNITDVGHLVGDSDDGEDKMEQTAKREQKSPYEIAEYFTSVFFEDIEALNIGKPEIIAKATDNINEMIAYVQILMKKGFAYETSDGIYFDISKFPDYGKLSGIDLENQLSGARVEVREDKRNASDFALWKKAPIEHLMQWESPWGMGFPGWHIECSAMCKKYLGRVLDIHSGGVDHIPIHHENEIAQSEALEGIKTVNTWMHGEFMLVNNGKMSKSLGNTYTIKQLAEKGYSALDFRYFCLNAHYRKKLNFTFESMDGAKTGFERLKALVIAHKESNQRTDESIIEGFKKEFIDAINDDINVPLALGVLWNALKQKKSIDIYEFALFTDRIFGLSLDKLNVPKKDINPNADIPTEIIELAKKRMDAKKAKDFSTADALRDKIQEQGYKIIDVAGGYEIIKA